MDFDDFSGIGDEQQPGSPIHIPISVNLEIEKLNRANKYGLHTKTNKTDNHVRKDQKYIALQLSQAVLTSPEKGSTKARSFIDLKPHEVDQLIDALSKSSVCQDESNRDHQQ